MKHEAVTAEALRRAFDGRFAEPAVQTVRNTLGLILIDVAHERFALQVDDLAGFEPLRRCVALAGAAPGVLGIAGVRGRCVPVFDLAQALGLPEREPPRWLALCGTQGAGLALAFAGFAGQVRVDSAAVVPANAGVARTHAPHVVLLDGRGVPVIDIASLAASRRVRAAADA